MSDGNFNRALLPHTPYESGLKMGKAMARKCATEVFTDFIREKHPTLSEEEIKQLSNDFSALLGKRIP